MLITANLQTFVRGALNEDIGAGDATTDATIPDTLCARARMVGREPLVLAGMGLAIIAFREVNPSIEVIQEMQDGTRAGREETLVILEGAARALLTAERVALNFVQRLSGIATLTAQFVDAVGDSGPRILDTRKTTPGWRELEKYAVRCGGGTNHRHRLDDLILIKDNHLLALAGAAPNPVAAAIQRAQRACPHLKIEVEADTLEQVRQAVEAGADIVLLDNMSIEELREAVAICHGRAKTEASGGVRFESLRALAETGVDYVSVGALTHAARWVDIGLDFEA
jgi:nicotinate-nucleotide pyrophosphorylase (carboxylating)